MSLSNLLTVHSERNSSSGSSAFLREEGIEVGKHCLENTIRLRTPRIVGNYCQVFVNTEPLYRVSQSKMSFDIKHTKKEQRPHQMQLLLLLQNCRIFSEKMKFFDFIIYFLIFLLEKTRSHQN